MAINSGRTPLGGQNPTDKPGAVDDGTAKPDRARPDDDAADGSGTVDAPGGGGDAAGSSVKGGILDTDDGATTGPKGGDLGEADEVAVEAKGAIGDEPADAGIVGLRSATREVEPIDEGDASATAGTSAAEDATEPADEALGQDDGGGARAGDVEPEGDAGAAADKALDHDAVAGGKGGELSEGVEKDLAHPVGDQPAPPEDTADGVPADPEKGAEVPAEEPVLQEPGAEVPAEEPVAEVPAEEPVAEEPIVEEPVAEEPVDEPPVDEPQPDPVDETPEPVDETPELEPVVEEDPDVDGPGDATGLGFDDAGPDIATLSSSGAALPTDDELRDLLEAGRGAVASDVGGVGDPDDAVTGDADDGGLHGALGDSLDGVDDDLLSAGTGAASGDLGSVGEELGVDLHDERSGDLDDLDGLFGPDTSAGHDIGGVDPLSGSADPFALPTPGPLDPDAGGLDDVDDLDADADALGSLGDLL